MPNSPTVSVVTPTLNQAHFLEWTLASVRDQSYPAIEHIVIDGGSTDATLEILDREGRGGTLRWTSGRDTGMYQAVNKGIAQATGEVLAYLPSDDVWFPWAVDAVMAVFAARPEIDLVYGDGIKVREDTGAQRLRLFSPFDRTSLASFESLMQPAVFWRRRLPERIGGFDESMRFVADLDYWLRAAAAGARIAHVDEVIAVERIHPGRLSSAQKDQMATEDMEMRVRHVGDAGWPKARARAKEREERWQRWLWIRFMTSCAVPQLGGWPRFIRDGLVTVKPRRVLAGSEPGAQHTPLWDAVTSTRAAELLGASVDPQRRRRLKRIRARVGLLKHALPHLVAARRALGSAQAD